MRVKIGNKIYDPENEPVMLVFDNDEDKARVVEHLSSMQPKEGTRRYAMFPDGMTIEEKEKFMSV